MELGVNFNPGDRLLTAGGEVVTVDGLDWTTLHTDDAYDLDIADLHTFYVGAGDENVLVHNCDFVDLVRPDRRQHILTGEVGTAADGGTFYSGGHRAGTGFPNKTEFPSHWTDDRAIHYVSDVATDPGSRVLVNGPHDRVVRGWRDNVEIEVLIRDGEIWTAYPVRQL